MDNIKDFEQRINNFIDRYYKISITKGALLFVMLFAAIILFVSTLEYFGWFSNNTRLFLFVLIVVSSFFIFNYFLLIPVLRFFGVLKRLTHRKTEALLRQEMPEIKDYVLNIIELKDKQKFTSDIDLISAAISQKISFTASFDFTKVLNKKSLKVLFYYFIILFVVYGCVIFLRPAVFSDGTNRIIHFNQKFIPTNGFSITLDTSKLTIVRGSDLELDIFLEGESFPNYLSCFVGKNEYLLNKIDTRHYLVKIKNVNANFTFRVGNENFKSQLFSVNVLKAPFLNDFVINVQYPEYIHKELETFKNISNLKVPIGSKLNLNFRCDNVNNLLFVATDSSYFNFNKSFFFLDTIVYKNLEYFVKGENGNLNTELVPKSIITVIPDLFPEISVQVLFDQFNKQIFHFTGSISDDYGFNNFFFVLNTDTIFIKINNNLNQQIFKFHYNLSDLDALDFTYFFEIFDNDGVNGSKSSKSEIFHFKKPDYKELSLIKEKQNDEVLRELEKSMLLLSEFERDIKDIKQKMYSENLSEYDKQEMVNDLNKKQGELEILLQNIAKQNLQKNFQFDSFNEQSKDLFEKQNEIQKLLDNVLSDDLKKLLEELQKLQQDFLDKELNKNLDKIELNFNQMSEQLDRNLELLKKYEVERNLENISKELNRLSVNQDSLANLISGQSIIDSLHNKDISDFDFLNEQIKKSSRSNDELSKPYDLQKVNEDFEQMKEELKKSDSEDKKDKFSKNSKELKQLADKLDALLNNNRVAENGENADDLRQILENLIYFSFKQESLNDNLNSISLNNPTFYENVKLQNNLANNFSIIKDSLLSLSKRTPQIGTHISNKVFSIESSLFDINRYLSELNISKTRYEQRFVLENSNDLILLLSESLKNMDKGDGGSGSSPKKKNKPKDSKPSLSEMRNSQESMKSQLESMIKSMKEGKGGEGIIGNEQIGKMIAQQEIFQQMLNQMQNESGVGKELAKQLNEISKILDQNKRDLINKNITRETLLRQNQIVTRLLEAEKADLERELDKERKSLEAINPLISNPEIINEDLQTIDNFNDVLNSNSLKLNYFYKNKFQKYLQNLN